MASHRPPPKKQTSVVQLFDIPVVVSAGTVFDVARLAACCAPIPGLAPVVETLGKVRRQAPLDVTLMHTQDSLVTTPCDSPGLPIRGTGIVEQVSGWFHCILIRKLSLTSHPNLSGADAAN